MGRTLHQTLQLLDSSCCDTLFRDMRHYPLHEIMTSINRLLMVICKRLTPKWSFLGLTAMERISLIYYVAFMNYYCLTSTNVSF